MAVPLLEVNSLRATFKMGKHKEVTAVDGICFKIEKGKTLGLVGESGCGKSVTSMAIMQLLDANGRIREGQILYKGEDLLKKSAVEMHKVRGNSITMIFQEPMTALNPVFTIGNQLTEAVDLHMRLSRKEAAAYVVEMLAKVGIPRPEATFRSFPHMLSGGMQQRVMIAMALICHPEILIADEPTTALDVTIQAQILDLMKQMQKDTGTSILFITHDLGVMAEMADRIIVMYAGQIVEEADVFDLFDNPLHPYTRGLMESVPRVGDRNMTRLASIPGTVPLLTDIPRGCRFHSRCAHCDERCASQTPLLKEWAKHSVRCWKAMPDRTGQVINSE